MAAIRLTSRFVHRCFCYHVVNCHDDPGYPNRVVVDVCKADATNALGMAKGFEAGVSGYGEDVSFFNENAVGVSGCVRLRIGGEIQIKSSRRGWSREGRRDALALDRGRGEWDGCFVHAHVRRAERFPVR